MASCWQPNGQSRVQLLIYFLKGSADDFVGLEEEGWGHGEAQGLGGFEVDDQLEFYGLLHQEPLVLLC
jgi:hypothetical protein